MLISWEMQLKNKPFWWNCIPQSFSCSKIWSQQRKQGKFKLLMTACCIRRLKSFLGCNVSLGNVFTSSTGISLRRFLFYSACHFLLSILLLLLLHLILFIKLLITLLCVLNSKLWCENRSMLHIIFIRSCWFFFDEYTLHCISYLNFMNAFVS